MFVSNVFSKEEKVLIKRLHELKGTYNAWTQLT